MNIEQRNRVRAEAGLPLLDVEAEKERLAAAHEQQCFEREWERRRPSLCREWTSNRDGWMTNMGRWSRARRQVQIEIQVGRD